MIDTDPKSVKYHQDNTIILDKWTGDINDRTLWDLIPFLLSMYSSTKLQQISSLSLSLPLPLFSLSLSLLLFSLSLSFTAIAASQVDDVRPVLNNYKSEGERNILETFKVRRAQLRAEEERQRKAMAKRSSHVVGSVPMFRLGGFGHHHGQHHEQQQQPQPQSQLQPSSTAVSGQSGSGVTGTVTDSDSSSGQSWVQWIGSWIGWK